MKVIIDLEKIRHQLLMQKLLYQKIITPKTPKKWITNENQKIVTFLRTKYNALLSTAKSINNDNSMLDCRINGLAHKSPN